jgi:SM-20-related protein
LFTFAGTNKMNFYPTEKWIDWVDTLSENNYVIIDDFVSEDMFRKLRSFLFDHLNENNFKKAGIGAMTEYQVKSSIRGDFVYWLESARDTQLEDLFMLIEHIKMMFNRLCYLSLSGYEFHLAHYPEGSFYKKHLDQFKERSNRMITVILYLNENWQKGDGGELKVYKGDGETLLIEPVGNRCVIFKSDALEHEVLLTHKSRYSLTGWLLYQSSVYGFLRV